MPRREEKEEEDEEGRMKVVEGGREGGREGGKEGGGEAYSLKVSGTVFEIEKRYEMIRPIGTGAYGVVM